LLQQRANTGYLDGYWDFAASGHVEHGETIQQTAVRELLEEAGVTAKEEDLSLIHIDQYYLDQAYVNWVFTLNAWLGEPKVTEPGKCSGMAWYSVDNLPEKCVNVLRATAKAGFSREITYSVTNPDSYQSLMNEQFDALKVYKK
jgi:8-oxo-dGTP diphosphatase